MKKIWTGVGVNLLVVLWGMQATVPKTWGQTPAPQPG